MDVDAVICATGEFGRLQKKVLLVYCLLSLYSGTLMVQNVFVGSIPKATCRDAPNVDGCHASCRHPSFSSDFHSFASEWKLTCGKEATAAGSVQSVFMAGVMVGSFIFGHLSDTFGRRRVMLGATTASVAFALASSYASGLREYAALRFLTAFFLSGEIVVGFVLVSELLGPSKRSLVSAVPAAFFAVGICLLSMIAFYTKEWRAVSLWTSLIGAMLLPPAFWTFCESPRWLLQVNRPEASASVLKAIAAQNGHQLGKLELKPPESADCGSSHPSVFDLFRHRVLRQLTLLQLYSWFANSAVYYGLTMAAGAVGSSMYLSVTLSGLIEVPSNLVSLALMNHPRLGRLHTLYWSMLGAGLACTTIYILPESLAAAGGVTSLALAGKLFITISFAVVYVQAAELFPTGVRNVGLGVLSVSNRFGGIVAPLLLNLDQAQHNLQFLAFGLLALTAGLLNGRLPETLNQPLPETADDLLRTRRVRKSLLPEETASYSRSVQQL